MRYWLLLLAACSAPCYTPNGRFEMTDMKVVITRKSDAGFGFDDPTGELKDEQVNRTLRNVLACVKNVTLTAEEKSAAWCTGNWSPEIRSCLVVKEAPVWYVSKCSGNQLFSCNAPVASCQAKGLQPTTDCPCACRAAVQEDGVIITTPNLELLPWRFVELITGCDQIQNVPRLAACGSASMVDQSI